MKSNCWNDSRDFQDAESVRSGQSLVTNQPVFFHSFARNWWNAKSFSGNAELAAKYLGHTCKIWKCFLQIQQRLLQHLVRKSQTHVSPMYQNTHTSPHVMSESQTPAQNQRCPSGPSARNHSSLVRQDFPRIMMDQQRLQISDLHFDKFTTPPTFACWKVRSKIEVCICSQFITY